MKGIGWIGIVMIGTGGLLIYAGFQGVTLASVIQSVINGEPLPSTSGGSGDSRVAVGSAIGADVGTKVTPVVGANVGATVGQAVAGKET